MKNPVSKFDKKIGPKSPLPFILQIRNWIYGTHPPSLIVRLGFYGMNTIAIFFLGWNLLSFVALRMQNLVYENKNISVAEFLSERAVELEIHPDYILPKLLTYYSISVLCWGVFLIGMAFLWRKKKIFFWLSLGALLFHIGMALFYVGGLFFWVEITATDKLLIFLCIVTVAFYRFFYFRDELRDLEN